MMDGLPERRLPAVWDPYDLWMTPLGVNAKHRYYQGQWSGKVMSVGIGLADWLLPTLSRQLLKAPKRHFPITVAQWVLAQPAEACPAAALECLLATASGGGGLSWGLGFPWMSKNGLYDQDVSFVTHTPYAMEALLHIAGQSHDPVAADQAKASFRQVRPFFESLLVMHESDDQLALSYAPLTEPRIVVNANSYAALGYALLARHDRHDGDLDKVRRLLNWVLAQQQENGAWYYYADSLPGNFIDGFHSCFVLKNLLKVARMFPEFAALVDEPVRRGSDYLARVLFDDGEGLLRRFSERDIKDPFVWDLYDQAEYLGLLVLLGRLEEAAALRERVRTRFCRKDIWYCRIDFFGRRWGRCFLRWGIYPFRYQERALQQALQASAAETGVMKEETT